MTNTTDLREKFKTILERELDKRAAENKDLNLDLLVAQLENEADSFYHRLITERLLGFQPNVYQVMERAIQDHEMEKHEA